MKRKGSIPLLAVHIKTKNTAQFMNSKSPCSPSDLDLKEPILEEKCVQIYASFLATHRCTERPKLLMIFDGQLPTCLDIWVD